MTTAFLLIAMFFAATLDNHVANKKKFRMRESGDIIYQWNQNKTKIISYRAFGSSACRPQQYRKFRLPFQNKWKEVGKEGDIDYCTGEIYRNGEWVLDENLHDNNIINEGE